jgi:putative sterol carrier protein
MTTTEAGGTQAQTGAPVELYSKEWCEQAIQLWDDIVYPNLADRENYNYTVEWGETDTGTCSQFKAQKGKILSWEPGKEISDEDLTFILWAKKDVWKQIGESKLDPVGAVASKRVHMRKGPMPVVVKEADAFKKLLIGYGRIPTKW